MKPIILTITVVLALIAAGVAVADDTSIYGSSSVSVQPNVLIIFDTSGSMTTADVPGEYYDHTKSYYDSHHSNTSYSINTVYEKVCTRSRRGGTSCSYNVFANDVELLQCPGVKATLIEDGKFNTAIMNSAGGYTCGGSKRDLYMGNWRDYDNSTVSDPQRRTDVAKTVIKQLIQDTSNVRFGLMRYNKNDSSTTNGGRMVRNIGPVATQADKDAFKAQVDALPADGYTPLAESLAEAGLYYAGKASWYNSGVTYTSPIQNRCQKNYIILMTDGEPTNDTDSKLRTGTYIRGDHIADYNGDGDSGYLDDVSSYLFQNDLRSDLGTAGESFERQNVITYTIGFREEVPILGSAAEQGGGLYYMASSISGLESAFQEIMATIADVNAVFVSPVVPVSRMNRTFAGNSLYVGFFKPQPSGLWAGNIKKYGLDSSGALVDASGVLATLADGSIKDNAQSYWSIQTDGPDVVKGGVGEVLLGQATRNLYTYLGTTSNLWLANNALVTSNANITAATLGVATSAEKDAVITDVRGTGKTWKMGDILHSQPAVVHYDTNADGILDDAYIFAGSNDGMLRAFRDSTGAEAWGFIPADQLNRLKLLSDGISTHDYYVDGAPVVYEDSSQKILFFGERRGGYSYTALDITAPTAPVWKYKVLQNHLVTVDGDGNGSADGPAALLGQSWGTPVKGKIKTSASTSETVFLLGGGYAPNQDLAVPAATDTMGRAVFTIRVADGVVSKLNVNGGNNPLMTHCITDVSGFDSDSNGYLNRAYAGDLGGNIFAFEDDDGDGAWTWRKLFSAGAVDGVQRKIMYAPDTTLELFGDLIFLGTGDRENPEETGVVNRLYAIKNEWTKPADWPVPGDPTSFVTLNENDLVDVTDNLLVLGNESERAATQEALQNSKGWYIRLENLGEKITASVTVFAGVVYFTTYTPETGAAPADDPCAAASGRGQARLYAVNYLTGGAVYDWSATAEFTGDTTPVQVPLGKGDRSKLIGTSIPSAPVIAVLPGGARMYIGVEGGVSKQDPAAVTDVNAYYWRQLN